LKLRCRIVASVAARIADDGATWTKLCESAQRVDPVETITAELLPLCSALKFVGEKGPGLLRTRRLGASGRPAWLWGVRSEVRRDPHGTVLVLGTWNYPLLLAGVQIGQALAAGNYVQFKPAVGCEAISERLVETFHHSGVPEQALRLLDSSTEAATGAIDAGVDLIVLTGSAGTGRKVLSRAADKITPAIMELSGCDAVVLMPGADFERASGAIAFGLTLNSGATCIGPRRLVVETGTADAVVDKLRERLQSKSPVPIHPAARASVGKAIEQAIANGAVDCLGHFSAERLQVEGVMAPLLLDGVKSDDPIASADLFAPVLSVIRVNKIENAVEIVNQCPYRLAASVFGPRREAENLAAQCRVGSIAINDLIVPTADPRVPFGGRGHSGFGVTRGAEGLLAMTVPVVTAVRCGGLMPHLMPRRMSDAQTLLGLLQLLHARPVSRRWSGLRKMLAAGRSGEADDRAT
jgi:aldehyde dehydrogenase (NAD+)